MKIPVWHDDQQGTAVVALAGLVNALEELLDGAAATIAAARGATEALMREGLIAAPPAG